MKRPHRNEDGTYHIHSKKYKELFGSRHQVWNKTAYKTTGNLTRKHLLMNKWGRIVSNKKHFTAKREKRLEKHGYYAKKGKFGYVKKMKTKKRKTRGGDAKPEEATFPATFPATAPEEAPEEAPPVV